MQVGDGSTTPRNTPVGVSGLSSGFFIVATGQVRVLVITLQPLFVREWALSVFAIVML